MGFWESCPCPGPPHCTLGVAAHRHIRAVARRDPDDPYPYPNPFHEGPDNPYPNPFHENTPEDGDQR
jgi:hypothetical protein